MLLTVLCCSSFPIFASLDNGAFQIVSAHNVLIGNETNPFRYQIELNMVKIAYKLSSRTTAGFDTTLHMPWLVCVGSLDISSGTFQVLKKARYMYIQ